MTTQLSTILFALAATQGPCDSPEKIPDTVSNVIKAVAFPLEEVTVAEYVDKILHQLSEHQAQHTTPAPEPNTTNKITKTLNNLSIMITKQSDTIQCNQDIC
jgi:hypothetical protein